MPCTVQVLYSSSNGNATLVASDKTAFLIDAGANARALTKALCAVGKSPDDLAAIFLTHEHKDHTAALPVFLKTHPVPVHIVEASAKKLALSYERLVVHPEIYRACVGEFTLTAFPTSHDSAASVGFCIEYTENGVCHHIGYATDLGVVTPAVLDALSGCEAVVLESNHDEEMLKSGPYPAFLKDRIASRRGHLSNAAAAELAAKLARLGMKKLLLAHLSETNNLPSLALSEMESALAGTGVRIGVASPEKPTEL